MQAGGRGRRESRSKPDASVVNVLLHQHLVVFWTMCASNDRCARRRSFAPCTWRPSRRLSRPGAEACLSQVARGVGPASRWRRALFASTASLSRGKIGEKGLNEIVLRKCKELCRVACCFVATMRARFVTEWGFYAPSSSVSGQWLTGTVMHAAVSGAFRSA